MKHRNRWFRNLLPAVFLFISVVPAVFSSDLPSEREGINFLERELNYVESPEISLLPDFEQSGEILTALKDFDPSGSVELLYRMPLPETNGEDLMLHILQSISEVSSLEGILYFSGSRRVMYPYLEEAFPVEKKRSKNKIDDPVFSSLPTEPTTLSVYQKDTTFGKAWYDVTYQVTGSAIRLSMVNTTTMRYKMFPVLRDHRLNIELIIIPREDDLLFYGLAAFKLGNTFGIEIDLDESFDHRMSALQIWFSNQTY